MFVIAALAVVIALGAWGRPAMAADIAVFDGIHVTVQASEHWVPNATAALLQGPVMWDNGTVVPPCFGGNSPCTTDPAGGVNIGFPIPFWPINGSGTGTTCNNVTLQACGQIDSFIQTNTAEGKIGATITITQGTTTIFTYSNTDIGTAKSGEVISVSVAGIELDATAIAGEATITVTTTVGKSKVSGKTTIVLTT